MTQRIEHEQMDAIIMSGSAIAMMARPHHEAWQIYAALAETKTLSAEERERYAKQRDEKSEILQKLCRKIDGAMQYIGEATNACDAADEHGMADPAFEAMNRALGRKGGE